MSAKAVLIHYKEELQVSFILPCDLISLIVDPTNFLHLKKSMESFKTENVKCPFLSFRHKSNKLEVYVGASENRILEVSSVFKSRF